eukprot:CAMPEP_0172208872 /NCGR_PEP_ID=MMETSP1050-20130122/34755_1 /TAXON_ID=233186 /ORGANISM="Cryptomonas curvata, Strain CCAP979/52" /LENGTH=109 /DNA_ID=CAMNT_0012888595 /DNA_START=84 /DNA_END=416 /DNA_ORIENTATION=-
MYGSRLALHYVATTWRMVRPCSHRPSSTSAPLPLESTSASQPEVLVTPQSASTVKELGDVPSALLTAVDRLPQRRHGAAMAATVGNERSHLRGRWAISEGISEPKKARL